MPETTTNTGQWLTIRVGRGTLSFSMPDAEGQVVFEPYVVKSGVSLAANLREAFKTAELLSHVPPRARVLIDSPVLMVPVEIFDEDDMETMHNHAFPRQEQDAIFYNVLPDLIAVAVFSMNKDLKLVVDDHFQTVRLIAAMSPVRVVFRDSSFTEAAQKMNLFELFKQKCDWTDEEVKNNVRVI